MSKKEPVFLYVEDDYNSRLVVKILIQNVMKFPNITIFEDSSNFHERVVNLEDKPDVIFLDVQIAPIDGYKMLEILRADENYAKATIIAMTANVMSHDVEKLKEMGFNGLIGKPLVKSQFPQLVDRILDGEAIWFIP